MSILEWSSSRVLVTGGTGFVGRHLIQALRKIRPASLVVASRASPDSLIGTGARYVQLDLTDRSSVLRFGQDEGFNLVFHLAGKIDQSLRPGIYPELFRLHVDGLLNLVDAVTAPCLRKFVCVGTNAEYGNAACPHGRATCEVPNSAYGVSKLAATKLLVAKAQSEDFPAVVLRPFFIYGPGQPESSFLAAAIRAAHSGQEFPTTPGEQTRDFVHVQQVVEDLLTAASEAVPPGQVVNSCSGVEFAIRDVLGELRSSYPDFKPVFGALPYRKTELMRSVGIPLAPRDSRAGWDQLCQFMSRAGQNASCS